MDSDDGEDPIPVGNLWLDPDYVDEEEWSGEEGDGEGDGVGVIEWVEDLAIRPPTNPVIFGCAMRVMDIGAEWISIVRNRR